MLDIGIGNFGDFAPLREGKKARKSGLFWVFIS